MSEPTDEEIIADIQADLDARRDTPEGRAFTALFDGIVDSLRARFPRLPHTMALAMAVGIAHRAVHYHATMMRLSRPTSALTANQGQPEKHG